MLIETRYHENDSVRTIKFKPGKVNDVKKESFFHMAKKESGTRGHRYKVRKQHTRLGLRKNAFSMRVMNMLPDTS